ncbi:sugar phosphate nucleotidyltransferase [Pedobacter sp. MC2016-05]|jgi:NDP-sugar pyrophosphorylase family protein|uniref:nucleotidyltransferase family protein n=1 Tax=unclassified Pedobacter TaxID=2628915 RepID=UPI000702D621|nr:MULTISPECIES: sugar phosphate nucleotidyltransferase [unclassified Pedobacter]KQN38366.1 nucleotidyltransferase [Pedobacter sp. Leaf41]MCX2474794.1 sugar phosphate nucleotidyltransferase [Pedobacter sp. MC2016-05]
MKPTLLILAAGMASRYGSMKQIDGFGPNGETIIDYSIYDAINAGFGKVVFIIKEEFVENFKAIFEPKLQGKIETDYVFQNFDLKQFGIEEEIYREKPWGTAHAILSGREAVKEPFCVINADDYYGFDAFKKMADFLNTEATDSNFSIIGYEIGKTLSEFGAVSRGVCKVDESGNLTEIVERTKVYPKDGKIFYEEDGEEFPLDFSTPVSMNFWGFTPAVFKITEELFVEFAKANKDKPKAEFFIPLIGENLVKSNTATFKVVPTSNKWFGVTYKEDKPFVQDSIDQLVKNGTYPTKLWS